LKLFRVVVSVISVVTLTVAILLLLKVFDDKYPLVVNLNDKPAKLLLKPDASSKVVDTLEKGESARLKHYSGTRNWLYIELNDRQYVVHHSRVEDGYLSFFGFKFSRMESKLVLAVFCILLSLFGYYLYVGYKQGYLKKELARRKKEISRLSVGNMQLQDYVNRLSENERNLTSKIDSLNYSQKEKIKQLEAVNHVVKKEYAERLMSEVKEELNANHAATIDEMDMSFKNLSSKYQKAVADAKIMDVDLKHYNFESILKGRQFEICIAKSLTCISGFKLKEWTPDKGIGSKIFVESNLNPDLVFTDGMGNEFAVECKFRGKVGYKSTIIWSSVEQGERYKKFQKERSMPVWVAIGVAGNAEKPDLVSLAPLDSIKKNSYTDDTFEKNEFLNICEYKYLKNSAINIDFKIDLKKLAADSNV
jgi:cell division protein FtsL